MTLSLLVSSGETRGALLAEWNAPRAVAEETRTDVACSMTSLSVRAACDERRRILRFVAASLFVPEAVQSDTSCLCFTQGNVKDFQLWVVSRRDNVPYPLIGERQTLVSFSPSEECVLTNG